MTLHITDNSRMFGYCVKSEISANYWPICMTQSLENHIRWDVNRTPTGRRMMERKVLLLVSVPFSTKGDYLLIAFRWQRSSGIISQSGTSGGTPMWHRAWIQFNSGILLMLILILISLLACPGLRLSLQTSFSCHHRCQRQCYSPLCL